MRRALVSVYDKDRLIEVGNALQGAEIEIVSTGSTAKTLKSAGVSVTEVSDYTGFPEIMDGRVKSLHPRIHAGILADQSNSEHMAAIAGLDISPFDLVIINLYPFAQTVASGASFEESIEQIDIGGPSMLRGAAKNHNSVALISDPSQYDQLLKAISDGGFTQSERRQLALEGFRKTAEYDLAIATWLSQSESHELPDWFGHIWSRKNSLRYGENPHQAGALFVEAAAGSGIVATARFIQGKELSFNNIADADAALECVKAFSAPACVIVKHANPCGVATAGTLLEAYESAFRTDPTSAFGGIIAFNQPLDAQLATAIVGRQFVEVIAAPQVTPDARAVLVGKPNIRVLELGSMPRDVGAEFEYRSVAGGLLAQSRDLGMVARSDLKVVTRRQPSEHELDDLLFAWQVCKFVKSNAIVYARDRSTVGVGAGQMSRVYSSRVAAMKAADEKLDVKGAVMASDAFFPFRDGLDVAAEYGIAAVIQPGGSLRDAEVIAAADEHGMTMVFTGMRHFRH